MSKNHKPYDESELQQADATAHALGELSPAETKQFERSKALGESSSTDSASELERTRRLGQLLRADIAGDVAGVGSTSGESIRCSTQVRESVLAALDAQEMNLPPKLIKPELTGVRRNRTRIWAWSLVASVAVAIGAMFWLPTVQNVREASRRNDRTQPAQVVLRPGDIISSESIRHSERRLTSSSIVGDGAGQPSFQFQGKPQTAGGEAELQDLSVSDGKSLMAPEVGPPQSASVASQPSAYSSQPSPVFGVDTPQLNLYAQESQAGRIRIGGEYGASNSLILQGQSTDATTAVLEAMAANDRRPEAETLDRGKSEALSQDRFGTSGEMPSRSLNEGNGDQSVLQSLPNETGLPARTATAAAKGEELYSEGQGLRRDSWSELKDGQHYGYRYEARRNPANEQYKSVPENPFWRPIGEKAMSTFSIDVDTASYANVRRFLNEGSLPPPDAVRLEEFINYFHYDYPQPEEGAPFAVDLKLFGCPWNAQHSLLRVGLHGREIEAEKRPISNIVYLVDVSGSMSDENKLPLLKRGLSMMVDHLSENDTVSIVTYAGDAGVRLEPTNGANKKKILDAIDSLQSGGSTNGAAGIEIAYRLAQQNFVQEGANRVILMTDGDLNVGVTSDDALVSLIKEKAASGVFLTVLGFGTGNLKDGKLEGLADNGNGIYGYIDSLGEAHKVLVEQMSGNLVTIAKDVKIQIEFNPAQVAGYRLIGYENRVMANQDFANDRKDAGEIGAGHTVTALYEIVPVGAMLGAIDQSSPTLKYQTVDAPSDDPAQPKADLKLTEAAASGELARVALRFKTPEGTESRLIEFTTKAEVTSFSQADNDCRFAAAVAGFGMRLRQSPYAGNITLDAIAEIASAAIGNDSSGHRAEFVDLVRRAKSLQSSGGE